MWLRAHERQCRWEEERILVPHEMTCTIKTFRRRAEDWDRLAERNKDLPGHCAYARRQSAQWVRLAKEAQVAFDKVQLMYTP